MARSKPPTKLLVLCHGNKYRSPFAAAVVAAHAGPGVEVRSAGFSRPGLRAARPVRAIAAAFNFDLEAHRSAAVTGELLAWAELIIYMDGGNLQRLQEALRAAGIARPYACLGAYCAPARARVPDPAFISDRNAFVRLMCDIEAGGRRLAASLRRPEKRKPKKKGARR